MTRRIKAALLFGVLLLAPIAPLGGGQPAASVADPPGERAGRDGQPVRRDRSLPGLGMLLAQATAASRFLLAVSMALTSSASSQGTASTAACALTTTIGRGASRMIAAMAPSPSSTGISTSMVTRSGDVRWSSASASRPSPAVATTRNRPEASIRSANTRRTIKVRPISERCAHKRPQRTRVPGSVVPSGVSKSDLPPSGLAASTIPFDSIPINFAGFRLATMTTERPTSVSGS